MPSTVASGTPGDAAHPAKKPAYIDSELSTNISAQTLGRGSHWRAATISCEVLQHTDEQRSSFFADLRGGFARGQQITLGFIDAASAQYPHIRILDGTPRTLTGMSL